MTQVDPQGDRLEPAHHERAVGAREVGVHHESGASAGLRSGGGGGRTCDMRVHVLSRTHELEGTPDEVFPFFADAFNLESITPDFLDFSVLTPAPILLTTGTVIQYAMRLHGVPVTWVSSIQRGTRRTASSTPSCAAPTASGTTRTRSRPCLAAAR